ncbi:MAG: DUF2125 domain-containing protein [Pseudomonadota bacterium]
MIAGSAQADVSASQVWESFKTQLALIGTIEAQESQVGTKLTVSDIKLRAAQGDISGSATLQGTLTFTENADGSVSVDIPEGLSGPVSINGPSGPASFTYRLMPDAFAATASGEQTKITYALEADRITHSFFDISIDGEDDFNGTLDVVTAGLTGGWTKETQDAASVVTATYRYDQVALSSLLKDGANKTLLDINGVALGVSAGGMVSIPDRTELTGPEGFLTSGVTFDSRTSYENFSYEMSGSGIEMQAAMGAGFVDAKMDTTALDYETQATDLNIKVQPGPFMPPIDLSLAGTQSQLRATIPNDGQAQDITGKLVYQDAVLGDGLWGLFDPQGHLPRTPINLSLDTEATGGIDYLRETAPLTYLLLKANDPQPLQSVTVKELYLNAAGAELQGKGAFTFDNSDLDSFAGLPRPEGRVDLELKGGFGLLDNLAKTGLLPDVQAQGIKAMAGFFAKPGSGPDTLTSQIEITKDGRILANGVPIQ